MPTPIILNDFFKVLSYNGGPKNDNYAIENAFVKPFSNIMHCSDDGKNFDLVMEYTGKDLFTLTHFVIHGPTRCTSPVKTGLVGI